MCVTGISFNLVLSHSAEIRDLGNLTNSFVFFALEQGLQLLLPKVLTLTESLTYHNLAIMIICMIPYHQLMIF